MSYEDNNETVEAKLANLAVAGVKDIKQSPRCLPRPAQRQLVSWQESFVD